MMDEEKINKNNFNHTPIQATQTDFFFLFGQTIRLNQTTITKKQKQKYTFTHINLDTYALHKQNHVKI